MDPARRQSFSIIQFDKSLNLAEVYILFIFSFSIMQFDKSLNLLLLRCSFLSRFSVIQFDKSLNRMDYDGGMG